VKREGRVERRSGDWTDVRERLAQATREGTMEPSPEEARRILEERARALASARVDVGTNEPSLEVIVFEVGGEKYGIGTSFVREAVNGAGVTRVPGAPPYFSGIANVRGEIIAVLDLPAFFGVSAAEEVRPGLLVLGQEHTELSIACREVSEVERVPRSRLLPPPRACGHGGRRHIVGVTDEALIVIDGAALLDDERLFVEQAEESQV